jgi:exonuclease SbcD
MKLLHTGDWHVGKVLKGLARLDEQRAVLAEIVEIARREEPDLVVIAGDVFESAAPPPDAQALAWRTVLDLRATGADVVVIAGNHDSPDAFDALRPVFAGLGITVVGRPRRPDDGGVVELTTRGGERVVVALLPFVSQRGVVKAAELFALDLSDLAAEYATRLTRLIATLAEHFRSDAVNVLVAHGTVRGSKLGGGERDAQTVFDYTFPANAFPASASYVALGHLHRRQDLPAPCPAWYSGSPFGVDFGEESDTKGVLLVDALVGRPAQVRAVALASARRLRTIRGTVAALVADSDSYGDDLLRVVVTEAARAGLVDEVRASLPNALEVRVERSDEPATTTAARGVGQRSARELFAAYCAEQNIADPRLARLFDELYDEATAESSA